MADRLRVLMIVEQCNPEWPSVPWVGYKFYAGVAALADVTLVTHARNREALLRRGVHAVCIDEPAAIRAYYGLVHRLTARGRVNWPLLHVLSYPVYAAFDRAVLREFGPRVRAGEFDVVHALTPMMPRYPYSIASACGRTPFVLGPVNGGVPFPPGFRDVGRLEFSRLNFLRRLSWLLPGYRSSYARAARVLAGSRYTRNLVMEMFGLDGKRVALFAENGVEPEFFRPQTPRPDGAPFSLLFVGRLSPYKGADMVIEALARLSVQLRPNTLLTIAGEGSERPALERLAAERGVGDRVRFLGQVGHAELAGHYAGADLFCFPSVREFGGAVVLEAMACGVPPLVVDNGGIAEYVTSECGVRIAPLSRAHVVEELASQIERLLKDSGARAAMSAAARRRAAAYAWEAKAAFVLRTYNEAIAESGGGAR